MSDYEVFPNAPVEEAIITLRLPMLRDPGVGAEDLETGLRESYPVVELVERNAREAVSSASERHTQGFRLLSQDRQQAVQVTPGSLSFHRLRPYTRWEAFSRAAQEAWGAFGAVYGAIPVTEVQLRYLNVFHLPLPFENWDDYLVLHPNLPPPVNTGLANYMMSLDLADENVPAVAVVTQATQPAKNGVVPVVLDIHTRSEMVPAEEWDDAMLWRTLDRLREYKNRLFFEGLTERAKELFR